MLRFTIKVQFLVMVKGLTLVIHCLYMKKNMLYTVIIYS